MTIIAILASALCVTAVITMRTAAAGYSDVTANASMWSTGTVAMSDDDGGSTLFSTGSGPNDGLLNAGQVLTPRCITVSYTGNFNAGNLYSVSSVSDDFTTLDTTTNWNVGNPGQVSIVSGALNIVPGATYGSIGSKATYDMRNTVATVEMVQRPNVGNNTTEAGFEFQVSAGNNVAILVNANTIIARETIGNTKTNLFVGTWNAVNMRWWRIRNTGGTTSWQYSADALTWTTMFSKVSTLNLGAVQLRLYSGYYGTEPSPGAAKYDNYSFLPYNAGRYDDFTSADSSRWSGYGSGVTVTSGAAQITPTASYPGLTSPKTYDFRQASATIEAAQVPNLGNGTTSSSLTVGVDGSNNLELLWGGNSLIARQKLAGATTDISMAYNATAMRWWRIKSVGQSVLYQYSADNLSWTTLRTLNSSMLLSNVYFGLYSGFYGTEPSPGAARFDNFSFAPNTGIKLYASSSGALAPYLNMTVEKGTGGSFASCSGFAADSTLYSGTLSGFTAAAGNYANGVGSWAPGAGTTSRTYRISMNVTNDNAIFGLVANATFTWEAQTD